MTDTKSTGARILIVEDDGIIADRLKSILTKLGYEVLGAVASGEEALQKVGAVPQGRFAEESRRKGPLDLVLVDVYLAGELNGIETATQIHTQLDIPVVYLTAYSDDALLQQAKITKPYGYLLKPIQDRELHATIEMALHRHELEQKLKEHERWLDTTLRSIGDAVIATDEKGCVTFMNPIAEGLTGWKQKKALGHGLSEVFHIVPVLPGPSAAEGTEAEGNETTDGLAENLVEFVLSPGDASQSEAEGKAIQGDVAGLANHTLLIKKDGTIIPIDNSAAPIRDDKGNITGVVLVFRDISERVRAEEQLQRYAAELEQRNEELKQFAYIISHDMRAPLINIRGFSGELDRALREIDSTLNACLPHADEKERAKITALFQEDVLEALGFIDSSVSRMDRLINAILRLSRLGRRELEPEPINMEDLVQSLLKSLAHQIEQGSVRVRVGALPEVVADRISMEQIVGNILDNAVKYLEPGRPGEIEITAERGPEETTFHIRDNGRGIAKKDVPRIFEIFRRAGKQDVPGEGMGLTYAGTLIRRHGGRIWCESEPGVGTTFGFTIPN